MSIEQFAEKNSSDNNHMVKKLAGLGVDDRATEEDLRMAMRTLRKRFVVGLTDRMEESIHRFNVVMTIDEMEEDNRRCLDNFFHPDLGAKKINSYEHPVVSLISSILPCFRSMSSSVSSITCIVPSIVTYPTGQARELRLESAGQFECTGHQALRVHRNAF